MLDSLVSFFTLILIQRSIEEVHRLSKLVHENILPLLGITTKFDLTVSLVSPWIRGGNAHDYVQNKAIDPRPIVSRSDSALFSSTFPLDRRNCSRAMLPA